ncbi:MAG: STAS domain-containing protein [Planctomycetes bacterium]|nr:STAS domain-containing protein [Planctomycetota bacterium]
MTDPKGKVNTVTVGDIVIATFMESRILDETTILHIMNELGSIAAEPYKLKLLVDFANVEYLSSAVLGKIVALHKKITAEKGQFKLCGIKPAILQVFQITKLDKLLEIHPDQAKALNAFKTKKFF